MTNTFFQMVRKYVRKTDICKWIEEQMQAAINDVRNDVKKLRQAARAYNVPVVTLSFRLKTGNARKSNASVRITLHSQSTKKNKLVSKF